DRAVYRLGARPVTPMNVLAAGVDGQINLSWTASPGAASYNVYRSIISGGEGITPFRTGVAGTSFVDSGLANGVTYYYEVSAVNSAGESPLSPEVSATPAPATLTGLNPSSTPEGGSSFLLTVNGTNFATTSQVQWNGTALSTTL